MCLKCPTVCLTCLSSTVCPTCVLGYVALNNFCYACNLGCKTCPAAPATCTSCLDGFFFDGVSACTPCTPPCTVCTSATACIQSNVYATPTTFSSTIKGINKCSPRYPLGYIYGGYTLMINVSIPSISGAPGLSLSSLNVLVVGLTYPT